MAKRKKALPKPTDRNESVANVTCEKLRDLFDAALALRTRLNIIMGMIGEPGETVMREDFPHHLRTIAGHTESVVKTSSRFVRSLYTVREITDVVS